MSANINVWDHVTKGDPSGKASCKVICNHCSHEFVGNPTKIKNHLLAGLGVKACKACPESFSTALREADAAKTASQEAKKRTMELQAEMDHNKKARTTSGSASTPISRQSTTSSQVGWSDGGLTRVTHC